MTEWDALLLIGTHSFCSRGWFCYNRAMKELVDWIDSRAAHFLWKRVGKTLREFRMIEDGDSVAVALSGGKDSFALLAVLIYGRAFFPGDYSITALHVIGDARGPHLPPHPALESWLTDHDVRFSIRPTYTAEGETLPCGCQRCTWNRRRTLFEAAIENGCSKIAFGHHLDDLAQTALLNLVHHGRNETMAPTREYLDGRLTIIRPLCLVRENELRRFAAAHRFPPPPPLCPRGEHSQRRKMKEILHEMHRDCHLAEWNLVQSALKAMGCWPSIDSQ